MIVTGIMKLCKVFFIFFLKKMIFGIKSPYLMQKCDRNVNLTNFLAINLLMNK